MTIILGQICIGIHYMSCGILRAKPGLVKYLSIAPQLINLLAEKCLYNTCQIATSH